ncbi:MAG: hypothetical protein HFI85_03870 [Clostridia bacterium]|jgi:uncharacterized membrane protein YgcG|nr:hypothetical protein [Clostridia bacterium]
MDRKNEQNWTKFIDLMVKRCVSRDEAYQKLGDFIAYLNYSEAIEDCSKEFKLLFTEKVLNPIVEGNETTFTAVYNALVDGKDLNLKWMKSYSGTRIMTEGKLIGEIVTLDNEIGQTKDEIVSLKKLAQNRNVIKSASSCGSSSSSSRCGSSSSSSCGSSRSSSVSRCGSSSSSSCGSSISRC